MRIRPILVVGIKGNAHEVMRTLDLLIRNQQVGGSIPLAGSADLPHIGHRIRYLRANPEAHLLCLRIARNCLCFAFWWHECGTECLEGIRQIMKHVCHLISFPGLGWLPKRILFI